MKRLRNTILALSSFIAFCTTSCVEEFNAQLPDSETNLLVVDGNIISDTTVVFTLSRSFSLNEEEFPEDYNQIYARVTVKGSDGSSYSGKALGNGKYSVKIGTLNPEHTYHVEIVWEEDIYTSIPQHPLVTEDMTILFVQPDPEGPVYIKYTTASSAEDETSYYIWNYIEDWEIRTIYRSKAVFDPINEIIVEYDDFPYDQGWIHQESKNIYIGSSEKYQGNQISDKTLYTIKNNDTRLSHLYSTIVTQRKMTKSEYEYFQTKQRYTNEMDGLFTPQPSELPTNLRCSNEKKQAIGFVGVNMNVCRKQLYIPTTKVNYIQNFTCYDMEEGALIDLFEREGVEIEKQLNLYTYGYDIASYVYLGRDIPPYIKWTKRECVDCRVFGANPNARPHFWPNF